MDTQTILIAMLSFSGVFLAVIVIAFLAIRKRSSAKADLKRSLAATGKKSPLSKTAFYQKVYLAIATTPIIKRYLFRVRMRLELVRK